MAQLTTPFGIEVEAAANGDLLINGVRVSTADLLQVFDPTKPDLDRWFCKRGGKVHVARSPTDQSIPRKG